MNPMDDQSSQRKKRGRKKKVSGIPENVIQATKPEQPQIIQAKILAKAPESVLLERQNIIEKYENKVERVDKIIEKNEIIRKVHEKMLNLRTETIEEQLNRAANKIYKEDSDLESNIEWQTVILPRMIEKLCKIVEFLLKNGPMTKIENDIFDQCSESLKNYYSDKISQAKNNENLENDCLNYTYYPEKGTVAYEFINNIIDQLK